jgi:menaquinone-dependent protoporphyrinogen oxidase
MKKLLVIYGTTEGQTAKVIQHVEKKAIALGWEVTGYNTIEYPPAPDDFDMVILAGSVHMGKYQSGLEHYATQYADVLTTKPNAFISVSMAAAHLDEETKKQVDEWLDTFQHSTGWAPQRIEHVAGALKYVEYNWMKRMVMREIARSTGESTDTTQDHEYTDWNKLNEFIENLLADRP